MYKQKPLEGVGLRIITNPKKVGQCFQDVLDETQKFVLHISMFPTVLSFWRVLHGASIPTAADVQYSRVTAAVGSKNLRRCNQTFGIILVCSKDVAQSCYYFNEKHVIMMVMMVMMVMMMIIIIIMMIMCSI
jgi:hypothetical protein